DHDISHLKGCHLSFGERHLGPWDGRGAKSLPDDGLQHTPAVAQRVQVALAVDAAALVAGHLPDDQPGLDGADVHQGLDLEAVAVEGERVQMASPEGVV